MEKIVEKIISFQKKMMEFMSREENDDDSIGEIELANHILIEDKPLKLGYSFLLDNKEILFLSIKDLKELKINRDNYMKFYFFRNLLYVDLWEYFENKIDRNNEKIKKEIVFDNLMSYGLE